MMCEESTTVTASAPVSASARRKSRRASGSRLATGSSSSSIRAFGQRERERQLRLLAAGELAHRPVQWDAYWRGGRGQFSSQWRFSLRPSSYLPHGEIAIERMVLCDKAHELADGLRRRAKDPHGPCGGGEQTNRHGVAVSSCPRRSGRRAPPRSQRGSGTNSRVAPRCGHSAFPGRRPPGPELR